MACTSNTDSITLAITAGVLTADVLIDPSTANGLSVSAAGLFAPADMTANVVTATVAGTSGAFTAGFSGQIGPSLLFPAITNPSAVRPLIGLFVDRAVGETINWNAGSSGTVALQVSINGGSSWSTQDVSYYDNVPAGINGYGGHLASGVFGPVHQLGTVAANTLQFRMFMTCGTGGGNVLNSGDLDCRLLVVSQ